MGRVVTASWGAWVNRGGQAAIAVLGLALCVVGGGALASPVQGPPEAGASSSWPWCAGATAGAPCPLTLGEPGLMVEAGGGWVRRYAVMGPIAARRFEEAEPLALVAEAVEPEATPSPRGRRGKEKNASAGFRWVTASDGEVELARAAKVARGARGEGWLVMAEVWSAAAVEVTLKASLQGAARIFINGAELAVPGEEGPLTRALTFLPDDVDVPARLEAGWNRVLVALERQDGVAVAWRMRVRGRDGSVVGGLVWRGGPDVGAGCGWLGPRLSLTPGDGERPWRVVGGLAPRGVVPSPWPREVALRAADGAVLASASGWDAVSLGTPLEADLGALGEVRLEVDGVLCLSLAPPKDGASRARAVVELRRDLGALTRLDERARLSLGAVIDELAGTLSRSVEASPRGTEVSKVRERRFEPLRAMVSARLAAARAGKDPFLAPGFHVRAYPSPIDGTPQRYVVAVPRGYQPTKRYPLIILSHGLHFHPEEMMLSALGDRASPRDEGELEAGVSSAAGTLWREGVEAAPDGVILASHAGYGEAGPRPLGRMDVLHVVEDVRKWLSVEPTRVTVTGFSLGGSVAFWAGLHHADVFAGAAPLCGYPNLEGYTNVRSVAKRPWEERLLALEGVSAYVPNGRQLPLWMVHGRRDGPGRSKGIAERYQELGYASKLDIPEAGHDIWDEAYADGAILRWLASRRRNPRPALVNLRAGRHRNAALDWLRIDRFTRWGEMAALDGEVVARGGRAGGGEARLAGTVRVRTDGVDGFTLRVERLPTGVGAGSGLEVDGQRLELGLVERDVHLGRGADGRWELREAPVPTGRKVGVEGPLHEVWLGPYVVIVGTADPRQLEANQLVAERVATPPGAVRLAPRIVTDVAWGDRPLEGTGAILIGGPSSNRVTARLATALAERGIVFEAGAIRLGACRHAGEDVGLSAIVPNPDDGDFALVVHAGVTAAGTLGARYLPELSPDFVVHDRRIRVAAGDKLLGPRVVRQAGFFDSDWRLVGEEGSCASTR